MAKASPFKTAEDVLNHAAETGEVDELKWCIQSGHVTMRDVREMYGAPL
jgi:hypothetical protein